MGNAMSNWRQLKEYIDRKVSEEGDEWLDNRLFIECVDPETHNEGFETINDSDGWIYSEAAWEHGVLTTTFKNEGIVTLNINY